jgi:hypothetical protein
MLTIIAMQLSLECCNDRCFQDAYIGGRKGKGRRILAHLVSGNTGLQGGCLCVLFWLLLSSCLEKDDASIYRVIDLDLDKSTARMPEVWGKDPETQQSLVSVCDCHY